jgi:hypothetical protein
MRTKPLSSPATHLGDHILVRRWLALGKQDSTPLRLRMGQIEHSMRARRKHRVVCSDSLNFFTHCSPEPKHVFEPRFSLARPLTARATT